MNKSAGTGFMGLGIVLVVIGAIMRFAVTATTQGFSIHSAGMIALWVGIVAFFVGLLMFVLGGHNRTTTRDSVVQTQGGAERVQESENWSL